MTYNSLIRNTIMSKNKLIARAVEYYGSALTSVSKATMQLDHAHKELKRAYDFLEDQEQLMKRFKIDPTDAADMKDSVKTLLKKIEDLTEEIDDCGMGIEIREQEYLDAM